MRVRLLPEALFPTPVAQRTERCPATAEAAGSTPAGRITRGRSSDGRAPERHSGEARSIRVVRFLEGLWCKRQHGELQPRWSGFDPWRACSLEIVAGRSGSVIYGRAAHVVRRAVRLRVPTASHDRDVLHCCGPERFRLSTPNRQVAGSSPARSVRCSGSSVGRAVPGCDHDRSSRPPAAGRSGRLSERPTRLGRSARSPPEMRISYLLHARPRRRTSVPTRSRRVRRAARVDAVNSAPEPPGSLRRRVRARLRRGHDGASGRRDRDPQLVLLIADCTNTINLEFSLETAELRENSLYKIGDAARRAPPLPRRSRRRGRARGARRRESSSTQSSERRCAMSYLKRHGTRRVPQWAPLPGQAAELGRRLRLGRGHAGRGCAASSCSAPRAARYYASEWTLTRENAQAVEECVARGRPRAVAEIVRVIDGGPRAEERPGAVRARARGRPGRRRRRAGRRSRRCRRWPGRARTCSSSRCSSRASAAGAARSGARSAAGTRLRPVDALAYQAVKYRQRAGRDAPRPAPPRPPGAPRRRRQPGRSRSRTSTLACSSGSSAAARRTACRAWSRASSALRRRRRRRGGGARPRVPPAARGAPARST